MASPKHALLLLPALLAAMGGIQSSAHASDEIGLVANLSASADSVRIEPPAELVATAAAFGQLEASTAEAPPPSDAEAAAGDAPSVDDETLRRTIFEIVAEARSRIGFLPELAASAEIVRAGIVNADAPAAVTTDRRTIFDILAEAHGNPRFLAKESSLADAPANPAAADPSEQAILPPDDEAQANIAPQPAAVNAAEEATLETRAEADGNFVVAADDAAGASDVVNEPRQAPANAAEAPGGNGSLPQQAATPALPGQETDDMASAIDAQTHGRTIVEILAEARGNPRFLEKDAAPTDSLDNGRFAHPSTLAADGPPAASTDGDPHAAAREAHRRKVLETIAEARSRIGFLPQQAAPLELAGAEPIGANPALATEAPRRTIFDVLAEAQSSPRRLTTQSSLAQRLTHGPAAEPSAAPNPDSQARIGDAAPAEADHHTSASTLPAADPSKVASISAQASPIAAGQVPAASIPGSDRGATAAVSSREPAPIKPRAGLLAAAEIDAEKMDRLRGGFEAPGGLRVSFGIERAVIVNGVLQSSTQVQVSDLGRAVGGGSNPGDMLPAPGMAAVIQNGVNNSTVANLPAAAALATVVQNSLDNQHLQTITRINAIVNSAEMLRTTRMQQSLQDSLNRAALAR